MIGFAAERLMELEACRALLKDLPGDTPAAFVLILHLDPTHDRLLVNLLTGHTVLKVVQASSGVALRAGYLYVIPPGVFLTVAQGALHLSQPEESKAVRFPFDVLLRSLARDAGGRRVEGVVVTYVDITDRKRTNAALGAAMREPDRATRAKTRFLTSASHDLRQPLQSMALPHDLMARHGRSTEGVPLAALLDRTLTSMTRMLDTMLDVNWIESGIVQPDMRPVPLGPMVHRLVEEFGPQCAAKGLKLRSVTSKAWVQTDPQLLEQMVRTLLSNAVKYTQTEGILIGCRPRGDRMTLVVCDTGMGVAASERKAIFDRDYQVEKDYTLSGHGLGLGLGIVQRLSRLMENPVTVRSTPGRESAFMIALPVSEASARAPPHAGSTFEQARPPRQTGTILLVEDEQPLRDLLVDVLTREGHTVVSKADAKDVLAWAGGNVARPDLLVTDFDLHGGSNVLAPAQDLPDVFGGDPLPTIILTGDITTATRKNIANSHCRQVAKPVMPEILLALISDLMRRAGAAGRRIARRSDLARTTVHVVDDDATIRETTRRLFEAEGWTVVAYPSAEAFLATPRPEDAGCLLVENLLPGMDGVTLISRLRAEHSPLSAVVLTGRGDASMAVAAFKAGASDLIERPASAADLLARVRNALLAAANSHARTDARRAARAMFPHLTPREREIMDRVLAGAPNKIVAADPGIDQRTVENHRASVMRKTGAESPPALVRFALAANPRPA